MDCVAVQSHLGGSVGVTPAGGAVTLTDGGTGWLVGGLACVAGPEEEGAGVTELTRFVPFTFDTLCARGGSESLEDEEAGDAALSSSDGATVGCRDCRG